MNQRQNGRQLMIVGGGLILLVLIVGFVFTRSGGSSSNASAQATKPAVFANQTIPAGTVFKAGQALGTYFTVKQVPANLVPFEAYTNVTQIAALARPAGCGPVRAAGCDGQITTTQTIYQNTPLVSGMFSQLGQYRNTVGPSFAIPYGYVGIAVSFDSSNSVLGAISPGDTIDLIASWHGGKLDNSLNVPGETQYALDNMKVISVNAPPSVEGTTTSTTSTTASSSTTGGSVVLLARYQQALEIQHLKDFGWELSAVLRSAKATNIPHFRTNPVTDKWFFTKSANPFSEHPSS